MQYKIHSITLHHTDFEKDIIESVDVNKSAVKDNIVKIIENIVQNGDVRYYKQSSDTTEVINQVSKVVKNFIGESGQAFTNDDSVLLEIAAAIQTSHFEASDIIVKRLIRAERIAQKEISRLRVEVKKGSFVQAILLYDDRIKYLLAKLDHYKFIDRDDMELHTGIPVEKVILKTCMITYNQKGIIDDIQVYDSNSTISKYWIYDFLELDEVNKNEENTSKSFNSVEKILVTKVKDVSKADYSLLHNSLIGYYNQHIGFEYEDMIEKVFKNYQPVYPDKLNMNKIVDNLRELPEKKKFDRKFEVIPQSIRAKRKRVIYLDKDIDLTLHDSIGNLKGIISGICEPNDEYFIKIKVGKIVYDDFDFGVE